MYSISVGIAAVTIWCSECESQEDVTYVLDLLENLHGSSNVLYIINNVALLFLLVVLKDYDVDLKFILVLVLYFRSRKL